MSDNPPKLKDGAEWIDHEDCIIGDEAGLYNLIKACEVALEKGEYYGNDLGDYVGVKKLDTSWFEDPKDSPQTRYANAAIGLFIFAVVTLLVIGFVTVIKWLF